MTSPLFLVAIGGGAGAMLRYLAGLALPPLANGFPLGTFAVNVAGGLAMGLLAGWLLKGGGGEPARLLLGTGLLGGFTTFSAFSLELATMAQRGALGLAAGYALASVLLATLAVFAGLAVTR